MDLVRTSIAINTLKELEAKETLTAEEVKTFEALREELMTGITTDGYLTENQVQGILDHINAVAAKVVAEPEKAAPIEKKKKAAATE